MKKLLVIVLALSMVFSMSLSVFAKEKDSSKTNGKIDKAVNEMKSGATLQKAFKMELNNQKKEIAKEKSVMEAQKLELTAKYNEMLASGDMAGAAELVTQLEGLDSQILLLKTEMKQVINQRYMVIKTLYSEEELAEFSTASELVAQMYEDAYTLGLGSVVVKNNIIKMDTPPYIKGGRTIIPVRTITEELGASVSFDSTTQSVKVSKDGSEIVFQINSRTVLVNGVEQQLDATAEITNGRTYVPLRFIAETFGLTVTFDSDTESIDIEVPETTETQEVTEGIEAPVVIVTPEALETPEII